MEIGRRKKGLKMDQKRTKWRLDGHAWVISKIKECSDLEGMLETMPMKFEWKRTWGRHLTRNNKHYVQNEWDFRTITRISILMGQNVNENKAMTKVVIAIIYERMDALKDGRHCNYIPSPNQTKMLLFGTLVQISIHTWKSKLIWVCKLKSRNWEQEFGS